jgi:hypothetical protein
MRHRTIHDANDVLVGRVVFSRNQDGRVLAERMEFAGLGGLLVEKDLKGVDIYRFAGRLPIANLLE